MHIHIMHCEWCIRTQMVLTDSAITCTADQLMLVLVVALLGFMFALVTAQF